MLITVPLASNADQLLADLQLLKRAASLSVEVANRLVDLAAGDLVFDKPATVPAGVAWIGLQLPQPWRELVSSIRDGQLPSLQE